MRILVTGAGGASAISVWKSLHDKHEMLMADIDPCAAGLYLVPSQNRLIVPRGDTPEFVDRLLHACRACKVDLLIPTVDAELAPLADVRDLLREYGTRMLVCEPEVLRLCRDKYALLGHCKGVVPVPEYLLLNEENVEQPTNFPLFAKPRIGAGSRGLVVVREREGLLALPRDESYLVQELLPGDEYSVDVYVRGDGAVIAAVPRLRMKTDSGIAITARTVKLDEAVDLAVKVARHVGLRYVANIQVKRSADGVLKLLEINPRFPGTMPLTMAAGIDLPALMVAEAAGETLPDRMTPFEERMVVRYWTEHFCDTSEWEQLCAQQPG